MYFDIPTIVRGQADIIIVVKVPSITSLQRMLKEYSSNEDKKQLQKIYKYACEDSEFGEFLLIDMKSSRDKMFRKNFLEYLNIKEF